MSATPPHILAYQRALNSLARLHYDEMADLYAAERIRLGLPGEGRKGRHGTVSKSRRCGCARCREAHNAECRERRARGLPDDDPRHGTATAYRNHGCRCDPCREANRGLSARVRGAASCMGGRMTVSAVAIDSAGLVAAVCPLDRERTIAEVQAWADRQQEAGYRVAALPFVPQEGVVVAEALREEVAT